VQGKSGIHRRPEPIGENDATGGHPGYSNREVSVIRSILAFIVVFLMATFPATWLLMLFFGNLEMGLSYWGTFPMGILVSVLLGGVTAPKYAL
jgi:hypothetical protein